MAIRVPTPANQGAQQLGALTTVEAGTPMQNLQVPDLAFNARVLSEFGGVMASYAADLKQRNDDRMLLEFQAAHGDFERDLLYNPETGLMTRELGDARGITQEADAASAAFLAQYRRDVSGLSGSASAALDRYAQQRSEAFLTRLAQRELAEGQRHNAQLQAAAVRAARAQAQLEFASDEALAEQESILRGAADQLYRSQITAEVDAEFGVYAGEEGRRAATAEARITEQVDAAVQAEVDAMYRGAITQALMLDTREGRARAAELLQTGVEGGRIQIQPNDRLVRAVTFGTERDGREYQAQLLIEQANGDLGAAVELAYDLPRVSAEDRAEIVEMLELRMRSEERQNSQAVRDLTDRATALAVDGRLDEMSTLEQSQLPEATLTRLQALNRQVAMGTPTYSDAAAYNELDSLTDRQLAGVDLSEYVGRLSAEDMRAFQARQNAARRADQERVETRIDERVEALRNGTVDGSLYTAAQIVDQMIDRFELNESDAAEFRRGMNEYFAGRVTAAEPVTSDGLWQAGQTYADLLLTGRVQRSDPQAVNTLEQLPDFEIATVDLEEYRDRLTEEDFARFQQEQNTAIATLAEEAEAAAVAEAQAAEERARQLAREEDEEAARIAAIQAFTPATVINQIVGDRNISGQNAITFRRVMTQYISSLTENGTVPENDDLYDYGELMLSDSMPQSYWNATPVYQIMLEPPEVVDSTGTIIPVSERQLIVIGLLEAGRDVTAENMQAVFNATQQGE